MIALSCNAQIKKRQSSRLDSRGIGSLLEDTGKSGFHHLQGHSLPIGGLYTQRMHSVYVVLGLPPLQYQMVTQDSRPRANLPVLLILAVREQCKARTVNLLDRLTRKQSLGHGPQMGCFACDGRCAPGKDSYTLQDGSWLSCQSMLPELSLAGSVSYARVVLGGLS